MQCEFRNYNDSLQNCTFSFGFMHSKKLYLNILECFLFVSEIAVKIDHVFVLENCIRSSI